MNSFFYCNPREDDPYGARIFPLVCAEECESFDFGSCTFNLQQSKMNTARISLYKQLLKIQETEILTLETSFFGLSENQEREKRHFQINDFKEIGAAVCRAIYRIYKSEDEFSRQINEDCGEKENGEMRRKIDLRSYTSMNVYERLFRNFRLNVNSLLKQSFQKEADEQKESSGSDSDPSGDELSAKEINSIMKVVKPKQKGLKRSRKDINCVNIAIQTESQDWVHNSLLFDKCMELENKQIHHISSLDSSYEKYTNQSNLAGIYETVTLEEEQLSSQNRSVLIPQPTKYHILDVLVAQNHQRNDQNNEKAQYNPYIIDQNHTNQNLRVKSLNICNENEEYIQGHQYAQRLSKIVLRSLKDEGAQQQNNAVSETKVFIGQGSSLKSADETSEKAGPLIKQLQFSVRSNFQKKEISYTYRNAPKICSDDLKVRSRSLNKIIYIDASTQTIITLDIIARISNKIGNLKQHIRQQCSSSFQKAGMKQQADSVKEPKNSLKTKTINKDDQFLENLKLYYDQVPSYSVRARTSSKQKRKHMSVEVKATEDLFHDEKLQIKQEKLPIDQKNRRLDKLNSKYPSISSIKNVSMTLSQRQSVLDYPQQSVLTGDIQNQLSFDPSISQQERQQMFISNIINKEKIAPIVSSQQIGRPSKNQIKFNQKIALKGVNFSGFPNPKQIIYFQPRNPSNSDIVETQQNVHVPNSSNQIQLMPLNIDQCNANLSIGPPQIKQKGDTRISSQPMREKLKPKVNSIRNGHMFSKSQQEESIFAEQDLKQSYWENVQHRGQEARRYTYHDLLSHDVEQMKQIIQQQRQSLQISPRYMNQYLRNNKFEETSAAEIKGPIVNTRYKQETSSLEEYGGSSQFNMVQNMSQQTNQAVSPQHFANEKKIPRRDTGPEFSLNQALDGSLIFRGRLKSLKQKQPPTHKMLIASDTSFCGIAQSIQLAKVQRYSRKSYNTPFNQRFIDKILK